jgi:hypothetical protein
MAPLHNSLDSRGFPFPDFSDVLIDGRAERGEAVQDGDTDLELGNLSVEVCRGQSPA